MGCCLCFSVLVIYNATSLLYIAQGIMSIAAGKFLQYAQNIGFQRSLADGFFVRGDEKEKGGKMSKKQQKIASKCDFF